MSETPKTPEREAALKAAKEIAAVASEHLQDLLESAMFIRGEHKDAVLTVIADIERAQYIANGLPEKEAMTKWLSPETIIAHVRQKRKELNLSDEE